MKTPQEWREIAKRQSGKFLHTEDLIEAIQQDALSDTMANTTAQEEFEMTKAMCEKLELDMDFWKAKHEAMRQKWLEARRYLRAANKGAERNAVALALAQHRYFSLVETIRK